MDWYAGEILGQIPCMRMMDPTGRKKLYNDPSVAGIIYHTVKFCDFTASNMLRSRIIQMYLF